MRKIDRKIGCMQMYVTKHAKWTQQQRDRPTLETDRRQLTSVVSLAFTSNRAPNVQHWCLILRHAELYKGCYDTLVTTYLLHGSRRIFGIGSCHQLGASSTTSQCWFWLSSKDICRLFQQRQPQHHKIWHYIRWMQTLL